MLRARLVHQTSVVNMLNGELRCDVGCPTEDTPPPRPASQFHI